MGKSNIKIHEDHHGNIYMTGVTSCSVNSSDETMNVLRNGALARTTAKTNMNAQSSRSHAIFSMHITQQRFLKAVNNFGFKSRKLLGHRNSFQDPNAPVGDQGESEFETLSAKFHFVDLAGSERLKRTGATGIRAEEGININCGLVSVTDFLIMAST